MSRAAMSWSCLSNSGQSGSGGGDGGGPASCGGAPDNPAAEFASSCRAATSVSMQIHRVPSMKMAPPSCAGMGEAYEPLHAASAFSPQQARSYAQGGLLLAVGVGCLAFKTPAPAGSVMEAGPKSKSKAD